MATVPTPLEIVLHALRPLDPPARPIYDNTACCQRCGTQVRMASYTPLTSAELMSYICLRCSS